MRARSINVAALGAGLLSHLVAGYRECETPEEALQWFNYDVPVPLKCVAQMSEQATEFCRSYLELEPVTSYLSTVTPEAPSPVTVSETTTTLTTTTEEVFTTLPVTSYTTVTGVTMSIETTTTTRYPLKAKRGFAYPRPVCALNPATCLNLATDCVDLTAPNLLRRSPFKLEDYCRCLGIPTETVTADASTMTFETSTATETTFETSLLSETTTQTLVDVTLITETTFSTEVETRTQTVDILT